MVWGGRGSIGSLAKDAEEEGVQNVTVKGVVFTGTTNGLRIKSWARPSTGFVKTVRFMNVVMRNVANPIVIDQHYCPNNVNCPNQQVRNSTSQSLPNFPVKTTSSCFYKNIFK